MLYKWLTYQERNLSNYKFAVLDVVESSNPDDEILNYLAHELVLAHGSPRMIKTEYEILLGDAEEVKLDILKTAVKNRGAEKLVAGER